MAPSLWVQQGKRCVPCAGAVKVLVFLPQPMMEEWNDGHNPSNVGLGRELAELRRRIGGLEARAAALEDAMANPKPHVVRPLRHLPGATATVEQAVAALAVDGAVVIDNLVSTAVCERVVEEMRPFIDGAPTGLAFVLAVSIFPLRH